VLEAGASGVPVVAVAEGGPASLVENRHTGMLCQPDPDHIAGTVLQLAASPLLRRHLGASAIRAVRERSWERAMVQLGGGYKRALGLPARNRLSPHPSVVKVRSGTESVHAA
jgi:phosphatidylinositol alpha 1,6-mannosyltransferase